MGRRTEETWQLTDTLSGVSYDRAGNEILADGLYVELEPWNFHFLQCRWGHSTVPNDELTSDGSLPRFQLTGVAKL
jgi:hypothetical protein